jgi:hypothetical protein
MKKKKQIGMNIIVGSNIHNQSFICVVYVCMTLVCVVKCVEENILPNEYIL